jgi:hypothetical protein
MEKVQHFQLENEELCESIISPLGETGKGVARIK